MMLQRDNPKENIMYNEFFQAILNDRGELWRIGEEDLETEIWNDLSEHSPFSKKGQKGEQVEVHGG